MARVAGAGFSGARYGESRKNKMLAKAEKALLETTEKTGEWNLYEILAEGNRTRLMLNVVTTVAYTEADSSTEQEGLIGLQIQS